MELDPSEYRDAMHRILTTIVAPRPIGWISTRTDRRDNLAPYSYFNAVSTSPPVVMVSCAHRDGDLKDAPKQILESGEFVVNLVTEDLAAKMDATSAPIEGESEFDIVGLERAKSATVDAPRVDASPACLECRLRDSIEIYDNLVLFGEVSHVYVDERITTDGAVDASKVVPVGRLGGPYYTGTRLLDVERGNFGPWTETPPGGFAIDEETRQLRAITEEISAIHEAIRRIDDGESFSAVAADTRFDRDELSHYYDRRDLYLEGKADDERIEAALSDAGLDSEFTY